MAKWGYPLNFASKWSNKMLQMPHSVLLTNASTYECIIYTLPVRVLEHKHTRNMLIYLKNQILEGAAVWDGPHPKQPLLVYVFEESRRKCHRQCAEVPLSSVYLFYMYIRTHLSWLFMVFLAVYAYFQMFLFNFRPILTGDFFGPKTISRRCENTFRIFLSSED